MMTCFVTRLRKFMIFFLFFNVPSLYILITKLILLNERSKSILMPNNFFSRFSIQNHFIFDVKILNISKMYPQPLCSTKVKVPSTFDNQIHINLINNNLTTKKLNVKFTCLAIAMLALDNNNQCDMFEIFCLVDQILI